MEMYNTIMWVIKRNLTIAYSLVLPMVYFGCLLGSMNTTQKILKVEKMCSKSLNHYYPDFFSDSVLAKEIDKDHMWDYMMKEYINARVLLTMQESRTDIMEYMTKVRDRLQDHCDDKVVYSIDMYTAGLARLNNRSLYFFDYAFGCPNLDEGYLSNVMGVFLALDPYITDIMLTIWTPFFWRWIVTHNYSILVFLLVYWIVFLVVGEIGKDYKRRGIFVSK